MSQKALSIAGKGPKIKNEREGGERDGTERKRDRDRETKR